ncbi:hypothetical protein F0919_15505 [Taibaiella lutea]|uniref:Uncharacterized protein n=1 Tax=Taibaiella lutea TaxID=2608001 RepID=A0A5M6CC74_9BACT|nr:hypothetical protein F0919_15505 [Taibaiella lutea]
MWQSSKRYNTCPVIGFNFKYHTHQYQNQKGQVYFFNYEFGYLPLDGSEWILVVKRKAEL